MGWKTAAQRDAEPSKKTKRNTRTRGRWSTWSEADRRLKAREQPRRARLRGTGTWSDQVRQLSKHAARENREKRGTGTLAAQVNKLDRRRRRQERAARSLLKRITG